MTLTLQNLRSYRALVLKLPGTYRRVFGDVYGDGMRLGAYDALLRINKPSQEFVVNITLPEAGGVVKAYVLPGIKDSGDRPQTRFEDGMTLPAHPAVAPWGEVVDFILANDPYLRSYGSGVVETDHTWLWGVPTCA